MAASHQDPNSARPFNETGAVADDTAPRTATSAELAQAIRRISTAADVAETLAVITREARRLIGAHQSVTGRTIDDHWAQAINTVSLSRDYAAWRDYEGQPDGSGIYALVSQRNEPMRLTQTELEAHPAWRGFGKEADRHPPMRGWLAVPLIGRDGRNIGVIQLSDKYHGEDFTQEDENLLVQLAEVAAVAVENAQLYEAAEKARTEGEQRLREVQAERQKLAEVFQNAPSAMCILSGPAHVVERTNDRYLELIDHRDVIDRPLREALPEVEAQGFVELLDRVFRTGETYTGHDVRVELRTNGDARNEHWLDFVYQPIRDSEGTVTGIFVQGVDLTARKQVERALRHSEQRLRDSNASLEERVSARTAQLEDRASQLRALTAELTQAEQRERRRLGDFLHDHLQQLLVAGKIQLDSAARSIGDRDAVGKLERAQELVEQSIQDSRSLTAELTPPVLYEAGLPAALAALARWMQASQELAVAVHAPERADPAAEDLRVLLFQAARELLLNVVKHAQTDHAEVTARRVSDADHARGDWIEISVADAGRGFDAAAATAPPSELDRFGLFSLRERIAWLGGEMDIDSAPGAGTRVTVRVRERLGADVGAAAPAEPAALHTAPPPREGGATSSARPPAAINVVLADDHPIVREGLASALASEPDIVVLGEASDGCEAVELVRRVRPDVVVLDITMPVMSGIEAARRITTEFGDTRVIGLSVHEAADMAQAMVDAGAAAYVNKAEASDRLLEVIRTQAARH